MAAERHGVDFGLVAESYERVQVPAIFARWGMDLLEIAALHPGERMLDLACGTGIVARLAAPELGPTGQVVGLDVNEAMVAVARAQPPPAGAVIEWRYGNAAALPFADGMFDVVLCQQGLQHIEDRIAAVREMRRVLVPGGRAVASVFSRRRDQEVWAEVAARCVGPEAASQLRGAFGQLTADALRVLFHEAGFRSIEMQSRSQVTCFRAPDSFIDYQLTGQLGSLYSELDAGSLAALRNAARAAFEPYLTREGLAFPQDAHVVCART